MFLFKNVPPSWSMFGHVNDVSKCVQNGRTHTRVCDRCVCVFVCVLLDVLFTKVSEVVHCVQCCTLSVHGILLHVCF